MRIAYFSESLPPVVDGVSRTLTRLLDTMATDPALDFRVYSPWLPGPTVAWQRRVRRIASVAFPAYRYYRLGLPYGQGLAADLDRFRPHLIHAVSPTPLGVFAQRNAARRRLPIVTSYHTHFLRYFRYYGVRLLERAGWAFLRWFHNRCVSTHAPSPSAEAELRANGVRDVELWSRGVDAARFQAAHRDEATRAAAGAAAAPLLLYVGRLVQEKDLDDLVAACALLRAAGVPFRLALVGDGPKRRDLERRLPDAHFTGTVEGDLLARWYASADVFVFPSTTETFGNVVLEGMASALPVVATRAGGVADLVAHGETGLLDRPHVAGDFARAVQALLVDRSLRLRLGAAARRAAERHSWPAVNARLLASYERHVARSRPARTARRPQLHLGWRAA
jgi:glycosyltransferase involved in cell wall biosynthesis